MGVLNRTGQDSCLQPEGALLAAEVVKELVTEAGVQLVAEGCGLELLLSVIIGIIAGQAHVVFGVATDIEVLVALEEACDGIVSFVSDRPHSLHTSSWRCVARKGLSTSRKCLHIPQRPMVR